MDRSLNNAKREHLTNASAFGATSAPDPSRSVALRMSRSCSGRTEKDRARFLWVIRSELLRWWRRIGKPQMDTDDAISIKHDIGRPTTRRHHRPLQRVTVTGAPCAIGELGYLADRKTDQCVSAIRHRRHSSAAADALIVGSCSLSTFARRAEWKL